MTKFLPNVAAEFARWCLIIVSIAMLAVASSVVLRFEMQGKRLLVVQTSSMVPVFRPGDAITVEPVGLRQLQVGEIVSYRSLRDPSVTISHRIVAIDRGHHTITTKGDALTVTDPSIAASALLGQVTAVAPGLGRLLNWLKTPLGLCAAVYLPAGVLLMAEARNIWRASRSPIYQLYGR